MINEELYKEVIKLHNAGFNYLSNIANALKIKPTQSGESVKINHDLTEKLIEWKRFDIDDDWLLSYAQTIKLSQIDISKTDLVSEYYELGFDARQINYLIESCLNFEDVTLAEFKECVFKLKELGLQNDALVDALQSIGVPNGWGSPKFKITKQNLEMILDMVERGVKSPDMLVYGTYQDNMINQEILNFTYELIKAGVGEERVNTINSIKRMYPEKKEFHREVIELSKLVRKDFDDKSFNEMLEEVKTAYMAQDFDLILLLKDAIKNGVKEEDVMYVLTKSYDNYVMRNNLGNESSKVAMEIRKRVMDVLKNNPDKFSEIKEMSDMVSLTIIDKDLSMLELCIKHIDNYKNIIESCYTLDYNGNRRNTIQKSAQDLIIELDKSGVPIDDALRYTDILYQNYVAHDIKYPRDIINKIVELHKNKKLDESILTTIKLIPYDDNILGVINEIVRLKDEGFLTDVKGDDIGKLINSACTHRVRGELSPRIYTVIYDNYKEILDFYIKNQEILASKEYNEFGGLKAEIRDFFQVYNDNYAQEGNKLDLEPLKSIVDITQRGGIDTSKLIGLVGNGFADKLKDFVEKVDIQEYAEELSLIFEKLGSYRQEHRAYSMLFDENITAKEMKFLLDIQRLMIESAEGKPQVIDNNWFKLFKDEGEMPDVALDKLRYYIEMELADPKNTNNANPSSYEHLMKLYKNSPENIERIEDIMFNKGFEYGWENTVISNLVPNSEVLNKHLDLLDDISNYIGGNRIKTDFLPSYMSILVRIKDVQDVEAKLDVWSALKVILEKRSISSKGKKLFKRDNELLKMLNVVGATNKNNREVTLELIKKPDFHEVLPFINSVTEKNSELIKFIIDNQKITVPKTLSHVMLQTNRSEYKVDFIKTNIDIIPEGDLSGVAGALRELNGDLIARVYRDEALAPLRKDIIQIAERVNNTNIELVTRLCTDKDLAFPSQYIKDITTSTNFMNIDFAKRLCTDKTLNCPAEKIVDIIKAYSLINIDVKKLKLSDKIRILSTLTNIPKDILDLCQKYSQIDIQGKISELTVSLGKKKDIIKVSDEQQQLFVKGVLSNNNPEAEMVLRTFDFGQYEKDGLPLRYTREEFTANVNSLLQGLSLDDKKILLSHFGLEEGLVGYDGLPTNKDFTEKAELTGVAKAIQTEIEKFTMGNEVNTGDKAVDAVLNSLIQGFPEFTSIVGKEQHGTHAYSVDVHTLKVLQSAMNNPLYEGLTDKDKTILKLSALCHDFGKRGGVIDEGHASSSAEYCASILDKFSFPQGMKDRIIDIVDNHHWFAAYNTGNATAEDVAVRCRRPQDFVIYEILAKADFENVNKDFHLERSEGVKTQAEFDAYIRDKMSAIEEVLTLMYSKSNLVFDTQFVRAGEMFPRASVDIDGEMVELKVLNLNELGSGAELDRYGFSRGVTKDNARFTVHMTDSKEGSLEAVMILTQNSLNQSAWSTSLIKALNNRTYNNKKFGFIFDVDQANISEANYANTGSGYGKGLDTFKSILFESNGKARTYVRDILLKELSKSGVGLNDKEYAQLSRYLMTKKYTSQLRNDVKIGDKVIKAKDLIKALDVSRDGLFAGGDIHSEIVSINPRVKGLIAKVERIEDCPLEFLQFAHKHNLPIILMRPTKN